MKTLASDTKLYDISPLLRLETARYRLTFTACHLLDTLDLAPLFRGRIGYILKGRFCPFSDFEARSCTGCARETECLYIRLFAPTHESLNSSDRGKGKIHGNPPRPYTLDGIAQQGRTILKPGHEGCLDLTLLGRQAVEYRKPLLEALHLAATTLGPSRSSDSQRARGYGNALFENISVKRVNPGQPFIDARKDRSPDPGTGATLADWIDSLPMPGRPDPASGATVLEIRLRTPFQLKRNRYRITFPLLLKAIVSRLRDLNRIYHPDNDMGMFTATFHSRADTVTTSGEPVYKKHAWYSHHRKKRIHLGGLTGRLFFKGDLAPFMPVLAAGCFLGIGQKTAYDLGRFDVPDWSL